MALRTVLVQLEIDAATRPIVSAAWDLARRHGADLIGFCAAEPHLVLPTGTDDGAVSKAMWSQVEDIEARLDDLKAEFFTAVGGDNRASWRGEIGNPTLQLALNARAADLIVLGAPARGILPDRRRAVDPGSLILTAGRPLLVASDKPGPIKTETILIAWNDTREARRAVVDALPLLVEARDVVIATVHDGELPACENVADVKLFLGRHGVKARSELLEKRLGEPSEALLQLASNIDADLIVLGGYGHSRVRERTFGGMTHSVLKARSFHRLISN